MAGCGVSCEDSGILGVDDDSLISLMARENLFSMNLLVAIKIHQPIQVAERNISGLSELFCSN